MLDLAFLISFLVLLTNPVLGETGPKPKLTIPVINAPEELCYMDLLEPYGDRSPFRNSAGTLPDLDSELLQTIEIHTPKGWHGCLSKGALGGPI